MKVFRNWHKRIMDLRRRKKDEWEKLEVKSRAECIFNYCPYPSMCGLRCHSPRTNPTECVSQG